MTTIDTGNTATNVIPATCRAAVNIRFNDMHTGAGLSDMLRTEAALIAEATGVAITVETQISGEAFLTAPGLLTQLVSEAVELETGVVPEMSTSGGTSDARFIKDRCPVVEFGLVSKTLHAVDERVEIDQIRDLKAVYSRILGNYFG